MFEDRHDAGVQLAHKLEYLHGAANTIVVALPRGGVPVAFEVARELELPLDVVIVRKLGASDAGIIPGSHLMVTVPKKVLDRVLRNEENDSKRRERLYRGGRLEPLSLEGKNVIIVDDGITSGASIRSAIATVRAQNCARLVVTVTLCPKELVGEIRGLCDYGAPSTSFDRVESPPFRVV